jgi:hypothetical protein
LMPDFEPSPSNALPPLPKDIRLTLGSLAGLRWVLFIEQFQPLAALTSAGRNRVRAQFRPNGGFCLQGSCGVFLGTTSIGSGPG